jgi:hypothetical protein
MRIEDIPPDIREAVEMAGWAAADTFFARLEKSLPLCEWGGYQAEIGPLVAGIIRNLRSSLAGGKVTGEQHD